MEVRNNYTRCPQGHYYNAEIYSSCPYCASDGKTIPLGTPEMAAGGSEISETININGSGGMLNEESAGGFPPTMAPTMEPAGGLRTQSPQGPQIANGVNPFSSPTVIGGDITNGTEVVEPVVGWLVCIEGPVRGTDYRIHAGYNYIGREMGDIHIRGDLQISRQNHAMIAFDNSEGIYYVGPSAGRNLIKVNGKTVLNAVEIKNYDVISIGTTKLMFVALCGPHFSWSEVKP